MARFSSFKMSKREKGIFCDYIEGKLSARAAGDKLGITHQQVINFVASIVRRLSSKKVLDIRKYIEEL